MRLFMIALLLISPAICSAEIFKWVDEKGVPGFADDLGKVPEKFREKALSAERVEQAYEVIEKNEPEKGAGKKGNVRLEQKSADDDKGKDKAKPLFDGKEGEVWKRDFARAKHEMSSLEEQAAGLKSRMANPGKMSRGEFLTLENTARDLDVRIAVARKKFQALNDAADAAELPADFR